MSLKIWEFVALVDDDEGQEFKMDIALKVDCIQSIIKGGDDSVWINCEGRRGAWKIDGWDYETLVKLWTDERPLRKGFDVTVWRLWSDDKEWVKAWERRGMPNRLRTHELLGTWEFEAGCHDPARAISDLLGKLDRKIRNDEKSYFIDGEWWLDTSPWPEISE